MSGIWQRVYTDPVLTTLAGQMPRPLDELAAALNLQCQPVRIPSRMTAAQMLAYTQHKDAFMDLIQRAAVGESVQETAIEMLSDEGTTVYTDGFDPPFVTFIDVAEEVYNPDGSEKTE